MITFTDKITTQNDHKIIQKILYSESTETNVLENLYEGDWPPFPYSPKKEERKRPWLRTKIQKDSGILYEA